MNELLAALRNGFAADLGAGGSYTLESVALALLLAFVLGQLAAWVYMWTHEGLSYSRGFTQSLVLMTMVVALVMFVIGNSIVTAFGLIGALALVRFRNVLKDTRDTVFVFIALVLGMAVGAQRFLAAVCGAAAVLLVAAYLHYTAFGRRGRYDGHLSCRLGGASAEQLDAILRHFCRRVRTVSDQRGAGARELVLQVRLRDRTRGEELLRELQALAGLESVALVLQDRWAEV